MQRWQFDSGHPVNVDLQRRNPAAACPVTVTSADTLAMPEEEAMTVKIPRHGTTGILLAFLLLLLITAPLISADPSHYNPVHAMGVGHYADAETMWLLAP